MELPRRLAPPRLRRGIVARPRLSRALDSGWDVSLTLVVGPAGYGKTVAVELWLAERGHTAAWVVADARDDDPVRLWASVASAVERVRPGAGGEALSELRDPAGVVVPAIEALAAGLAEDGRPIVLVVDDVQSIGDRGCLRSLDHAVAALPEHVQLVLISRTLPAMRLARLRTQGQLVEVGAEELAFTVAEAQHLFAAVPGVSADEATVAALTGRTEGWAGVLYLAALWLRERGDPAVALRTFRGSQRDVTGYLTGEVLNGLDGGHARLPDAEDVGPDAALGDALRRSPAAAWIARPAADARAVEPVGHRAQRPSGLVSRSTASCATTSAAELDARSPESAVALRRRALCVVARERLRRGRGRVCPRHRRHRGAVRV